MAYKRIDLQSDATVSKEEHFAMFVDLIADEALRIAQENKQAEKNKSTAQD